MSTFSGSRGFTLIELLVVIAIIGVLSSTILASLGSARVKARDSRRLSDVAQMQRALELYNDDNQQYPPINAATTGDTECGTSWCDLETALSPYMSALPRDPAGLQNTLRYFYDSDPGDGYQTYGFAITLEDPSNYSRGNNDGGYYQGVDCCYYEIGFQPSYCVRKYGTGIGGNWFTDNGSNVCNGGN